MFPAITHSVMIGEQPSHRHAIPPPHVPARFPAIVQDSMAGEEESSRRIPPPIEPAFLTMRQPTIDGDDLEQWIPPPPEKASVRIPVPPVRVNPSTLLDAVSPLLKTSTLPRPRTAGAADMRRIVAAAPPLPRGRGP